MYSPGCWQATIFTYAIHILLGTSSLRIWGNLPFSWGPLVETWDGLLWDPLSWAPLVGEVDKPLHEDLLSSPLEDNTSMTSSRTLGCNLRDPYALLLFSCSSRNLNSSSRTRALFFLKLGLMFFGSIDSYWKRKIF